ncbi:uncharacterized protein LOC119548646 [Drosophila subpulchrella]|uniref:uncharacterized protein LOC119548646 n=1 Tax=Drosophila subpulchrella TaxID=1486046 RepID=UPI0018A16339|nr:uncharacterized protein LOC119548646 [Drosophila subpulchrella]
MFKIIIYTVMSLLMFKRISCDADPHLCQQHVAVNYTEMIAKPMEEYGNFAKYFSELGIQAGNKTVTKTRIEDKYLCCPGYKKSADGLCVLDQTTTSTTHSTTEAHDLTESTKLPQMDSSISSSITKVNSSHKSLILGTILGVCVVIIIIASVITWQIRKRRNMPGNESRQVQFDAEMQRALL